MGFFGILSGELRVTDSAGNTQSISGVEIAELEATATEVSVVADSPARLVYGSAPPHPHPLVLGRYSVRSSAGVRAGCVVSARYTGRRSRRLSLVTA